MKQLVILSGKGGTGKTCLTAAFAHLAHEATSPLKAILADADVDAANLALVLRSKRLEANDFIGGSVAVIDPERCQSCGICEQVCRFDAILSTVRPAVSANSLPAKVEKDSQSSYAVDPIACEGCAVCVFQCPEEAIRMHPQIAGQWYRSDSRYGPLFHAELLPAQENSGKLVTLVKQQARLLAMDNNYPIVIVDGPPGIGCPVISAAAGADLALIVAEPSAAGIHDMQRILETTAHFHLPALVCINKVDIFPQGSERIELYCREKSIELVGRIPFDEVVTQAMINAEPVTAYQPDSPASREIVSIWQNVVKYLTAQPVPTKTEEIP